MDPGLQSTWPRSTSSFLVPRSKMPALSPAWPSSRVFLNISTPVHTVFCVGLRPTISTSSPTLMMPCSMRPVTTVPRPVMVKTSSMDIKKGLSMSRVGSGMKSSTAVINSMICSAAAASPSRAFEGAHAHDGGVVAGELVFGQQLSHLELDEVQKLLVVDHVDLVEGHHD